MKIHCPMNIRTLALLASSLLPLAVVPNVQAQADGEVVGRDMQDARDALGQWVETRRIISKEKMDWELSRELLQDRIEIMRRQIQETQQRIDEAKNSIAETDQKHAELNGELDTLKGTSSVLDGIVLGLEARTLALLTRLPEPIRERVALLSQEIPSAGSETTLGTTRRFQNVVGLLNEVNKFNREITVVSESRELPDGETALVTAVYLGIGYGFYVDGTDTRAGTSDASGAVWNWLPADESAADIRRAIRIIQNEEIADFVDLPVVIK